MSFLPESYTVPQDGKYMKFVAGKNRFRILTPAVVGNLFWKSNGDGRVPVRRRMNEVIGAHELEWNARDNAPEKVKHFWAFGVWNYASKSVQIMELTQKSIMGAIQALVEEPDWGDPKGYDIIVTKSGNGLETEYAVQPAPAKPLDPAINDALAATPLNLDALFDGADPFKGGNGNGSAKQPAAPSNNPTEAAMRKAQVAFKLMYPTTPKDELIEGWKSVVKAYFHKDAGLVTTAEWEKFAADKFMKPKPSDPFVDDAQLDEPPF